VSSVASGRQQNRTGANGDVPRPAETCSQDDPGASSGSAERTRGTDPVSGLSWVDAGSLPPEALDTLELIDAGGPFPYEQDGGVFFNNERILPLQDRGYYHEYTVETPGSDDRGARRIVAGTDGELYWTGDHYQSFERIQR